MRRTIGLWVGGAALVVAACSSGGGTANDQEGAESTTTTAVDAGAAPSDEAVAYAEAVTTLDPDELERAIDLSAEGSVAGDYALHRLGLAEAIAGSSVDPSTALGVETAVEDGQVTVCTAEQGQSPTCVALAGFTTDDAGLLTGFTIDGADPGSRLVVEPGSPVEGGGVTVTPVSAYQSVQNDVLGIVLEVRNDSDAAFSGAGSSATYVGPDGTEVTAVNAFEPRSLAPGETALVAVVFDDSAVGGTLTYGGVELAID